jgi:hypothetical protein
MKVNTNHYSLPSTKKVTPIIKKYTDDIQSLMNRTKDLLNDSTYGSYSSFYPTVSNGTAITGGQDINVKAKEPESIDTRYNKIINKYKNVFKDHVINILEIKENESITLEINDKTYIRSVTNIKNLTLNESDIIDFISYVLLFSYNTIELNSYPTINNPIILEYSKKSGIKLNELKVLDIIKDDFIAACMYNNKPIVYNHTIYDAYKTELSYNSNVFVYTHVTFPNYYQLIYTLVKSLRHYNTINNFEINDLLITTIYDYYKNKRDSI